MSFFSGGKPKDKDSQMKTSQFYVEFLGWMECRGLRGEKYVEPVIRELRRRRKKMDAPPKLTIQVSRKDLKITQEVEEKKKRGIKKIKFPTIPARDVTFVHQSMRRPDGRLDDIVACIYLGYMPRTQKFVHVHVYRFDEADTASLFVSQMSLIVDDNQDHIREVEAELASEGEIDYPNLMPSEELSESFNTYSAVDSGSRSYSDEGSHTLGSDEIDPDLQSLIDIQPFDSVTNELKYRLQMTDAPILLPPKDYDTISRAHGNLSEINKRRCLNVNITGTSNLPGDENVSNEGGELKASAKSDIVDMDKKTSVSKTNLAALNPSESNRESLSASPKPKHIPLPFKDTKMSPQVPHKPTNIYEAKQSPQVLRRIDIPDSPNPVTGLHYGKTSSEIVQPGLGFAYPPKAMNSPMSPRMFPPPQKTSLSRQGSENSYTSEGSKISNRSDENSAAPIQHFRAGPNDDLYALPFKATKQVPTADELPPDYLDDDELQMPENNFPQQYLTRSLPADVIRDKLKMGNIVRPNSGELRVGHRNDSSQVFLVGPSQSRGSAGMHSPRIQRNVPR